MYASRQIGSRPARVRRKRLGDGIDWGSILNNTITTAGKVATVAETPSPTLIPPGYGVYSQTPQGTQASIAGSIGTGTTNTGMLFIFGGVALVLLLPLLLGGRR